jgi:hypothetical protein
LAVLDQSSVEGTYLGRVLLVWIFSMATVLIVVAPKIFNTWRNPATTARTSRIFVSGLALATEVRSSESKILSPSSQESHPGVDSEQPLKSSALESTHNDEVSPVANISERMDA